MGAKVTGPVPPSAFCAGGSCTIRREAICDVTVDDIRGTNSEIRRDPEVAIRDFKPEEVVVVKAELGSQIATTETDRGRHRKYLPYAVTFDVLRELMAPPVRRRQIGFRSGSTR
jgi:hypothetical protein